MERPERSATITIMATLMGLILTKLDHALWEIAVIVALCFLHIVQSQRSRQ